MTYPFSITTAEGIASSLKYAFQVYKEVRLAGQKYDAAKEVLRSIDLTLCSLEDSASSSSAVGEGVSQVAVARESWLALEKYLEKYDSVLGTQRHASLASQISNRLSWACNELDNKVDLLHNRINTCLLAMLPMLVTSNRGVLQQLLEQVADLKRTADSSCASTPRASSHTKDQARYQIEDEGSTTPSSAVGTIGLPCWKKRGGCRCRCHSTQRLNVKSSQHLFVDVFGLPAVFQTCDVEGCSRRDGLQLRISRSRYGFSFALLIGIEFQSSWLPKLSLATEPVCRYTSPGFMALEELQQGHLLPLDGNPVSDWAHRRALYDAAVWQKVASIERLFNSQQVSIRDVDPAGKGWLEKVLRAPWDLGTREAQWYLVEFLLSKSPEEVRANPKLLNLCAKWIGEGPHMAMLETLLSLNIDPGDLDVSLFYNEWPNSCDPGWQSEAITEDPMFVEFVSECVKKAQGAGFAGCDALTESLLTDCISEFERILGRETKNGAVVHGRPNALGQTALHLAIFKPLRLEMLLKAGMKPNAVDRGGSTPLMYAACYGQLDSVLCLLRYGAHPGLVDSRNGRLFMDYAILRRHIHVIEGLVSTLRSEGHSKDAIAVLDRCMCYYFGSGCHVSDVFSETLKRLLALGADVDVLNGTSTMLHHATSDLEAQVILDAGFTRVNSCDGDGVTPLMKVISRCDLRSTKELLKREAAVDNQDEIGWTALHHLMHSWPLVGVRGTIHEMDEDQFAKEVRGLACIHHVIRIGGLVEQRDSCGCACSPDGCSIMTIALHETTRDVQSAYWPKQISGILVDLMCILQNRANSSLNIFLADVRRYRKFVESGLEHSCCFRKSSFCHSLSNDHRAYGKEHAAFDASLVVDGTQPTDVRKEITHELGKFFQVLEKQSLKHYEEALRLKDRKPKVHGPWLEADEANDTFRVKYDINILPTLSKLNFAEQKRWLSNASRIEKSGGFGQRGTLQSYLEQCLVAWDELEASMQDLRSNGTK